jgi:NADH:ubiquinone oxidoreductase subunit D
MAITRRAYMLAGFSRVQYDRLEFTVPVLAAGDVNARVWIRIREVEQSQSLIEQILEASRGGLRAQLIVHACLWLRAAGQRSGRSTNTLSR